MGKEPPSPSPTLAHEGVASQARQGGSCAARMRYDEWARVMEWECRGGRGHGRGAGTGGACSSFRARRAPKREQERPSVQQSVLTLPAPPPQASSSLQSTTTAPTLPRAGVLCPPSSLPPSSKTASPISSCPTSAPCHLPCLSIALPRCLPCAAASISSSSPRASGTWRPGHARTSRRAAAPRRI
jgi:hypothetical protein